MTNEKAAGNEPCVCVCFYDVDSRSVRVGRFNETHSHLTRCFQIFTADARGFFKTLFRIILSTQKGTFYPLVHHKYSHRRTAARQM